MRGFRRTLVAAGACALVACASDGPAMREDPTVFSGAIEVGRDYHSYALPEEARVTHLDLDLTVDFATRTLAGHADLTIAVAAGARELRLDTRDLDIAGAELLDGDRAGALSFRLAPVDRNLGSALIIDLPDDVANTAQVRVRYRSRPSASGLQWLTPQQTAGKKHPFLFTQSQAIHARSWIPVQDTPAVRMTYSATIRTDPELLAVMSATNDPQTPRDGEYHFDMPQPIPSYLLALGVGDLRFKAMSDRTGVYAEPALLEASAAEFADTEEMMVVSEGLYGPYRWGRYDLLILPPSFPFGGMENPRLSFITPTVIAGDKSLVALIAHELAHSWSGNLVTNATWRDFWLNEGFTSFLTTRIMEAVYGEPRARMEYFLDYQSLQGDLAKLPRPYQMLAVDLRGKDPDEAFSDVPYVKGQLFLTWLEARFGRQRFDAFLREYFDKFAFESTTTEEFLAFLDERLVGAYPGVVAMADIDEWVYAPGLPEDTPVPYSDALERVDAARGDWLAGRVPAGELDTGAWSVHEWLYFLNNMPDDLSLAAMRQLDGAFALTSSRNNEVAHSWLKLAVQHGYASAFERLEDYLVSIGRRKLIVPLYEELMKSEEGAAFARRVYEIARPGYHPLAVTTLDDLVRG